MNGWGQGGLRVHRPPAPPPREGHGSPHTSPPSAWTSSSPFPPSITARRRVPAPESRPYYRGKGKGRRGGVREALGGWWPWMRERVETLFPESCILLYLRETQNKKVGFCVSALFPDPRTSGINTLVPPGSVRL
ncbi:hypothetical protein LZ32DRAFT_77230 [Colletotrichum eremochloae]|nr:hypothetical protein LZ32DRAFT_77230 [Colletotrichum eremochloae]